MDRIAWITGRDNYLAAYIEKFGFVCQVFDTLRDFRHSLRRDSFDLLLIDREQRDGAGIELVRELRQQNPSAPPIVMLSEDNAEADVIEALAAGADDFVNAPLINSRVVVARIRSVLRRHRGAVSVDVIRVAPFEFDLVSRTVTRDRLAIPLTPMQFDLAVTFFRRLGRELSRDHLNDLLYRARESAPLRGRRPVRSDRSNRALDTRISQIKASLGLGPTRGFDLISLRSFGYSLHKL